MTTFHTFDIPPAPSDIELVAADNATSCCTRGLVATFEGERIYCDCPDGRWALIADLTQGMIDLAGTMALLDAISKTRPLTALEKETLALTITAFEMAKAEHDHAEKKLEERRG